MEYVRENGVKVIVDGDKVQFGNGVMRKSVIGANFVNGVLLGGYLSSFDGVFSDESINIQTGIGEHVDAKIGDIKEVYEMLKTGIEGIESTNIYELSRLVLETVNDFFGGFGNIEMRMDYYFSNDFEECVNNKISDLKGTGAAMCVERAALSQNLLKSLGINSFFKTSGIIRNGNKEVHSYNLIEFNGRCYIFDSSIPNLMNGQITPLIAEIDKEVFTLLSVPIQDIGISVTVSHFNPYRNEDVTITYDSGRQKAIKVSSLTEGKRL